MRYTHSSQPVSQLCLYLPSRTSNTTLPTPGVPVSAHTQPCHTCPWEMCHLSTHTYPPLYLACLHRTVPPQASLVTVICLTQLYPGSTMSVPTMKWRRLSVSISTSSCKVSTSFGKKVGLVRVRVAVYPDSVELRFSSR